MNKNIVKTNVKRKCIYCNKTLSKRTITDYHLSCFFIEDKKTNPFLIEMTTDKYYTTIEI